MSTSAQFIAPDAYPQMLGKEDSARAMQSLRSAVSMVKAKVAVEASVPQLRAAILDYVAALEDAGADMAAVFAQVHEIRGFAETAGLVTTGRIAEILCRYMDDMTLGGHALDAKLVALHIAAIARAARAEDEDPAIGAVVAGELAALVARRLHEAASVAARP